ncbi:MAG: radical SAM protein, partial [Rhodospirillales bacterium]|nr:radical SAM protein [Rhodospirillales bacterium]
LGNTEKMDPAFYVRTKRGDEDRIAVSDIMAARDMPHHQIGDFGGRARAFVQVQQGCDHRCTFCIIPFGRGPNRSLPVEQISDQVRGLTEKGFAEVVLSGVDLTSYGGDLPGHPSLGSMVRSLLDSAPDLKRLRLSSLDPAAIDDELVAVLAGEDRLMPHIHLSLQAGDDTVLKRMKRRHSRAQAIDACDRLRTARPDVVFGADLIAGFPTEDAAMFDNTFRLVEDCGLIYLHVFPFSARPGTPAAKMPQVAAAERKARAATLRTAGEAALGRYLQGRVGTLASVLVEEDRIGHDAHFAPVRLTFDAQAGAMVDARITAVDNGNLIGEKAE